MHERYPVVLESMRRCARRQRVAVRRKVGRRHERQLEERCRAAIALHLVDAASQIGGLRARREQVRRVRGRQRQPKPVAGAQLRHGREDLDVVVADRVDRDGDHRRACIGVVGQQRPAVAGPPGAAHVERPERTEQRALGDAPDGLAAGADHARELLPGRC
jgi:hypothetical protein